MRFFQFTPSTPFMLIMTLTPLRSLGVCVGGGGVLSMSSGAGTQGQRGLGETAF